MIPSFSFINAFANYHLYDIWHYRHFPSFAQEIRKKNFIKVHYITCFSLMVYYHRALECFKEYVLAIGSDSGKITWLVFN